MLQIISKVLLKKAKGITSWKDSIPAPFAPSSYEGEVSIGKEKLVFKGYKKENGDIKVNILRNIDNG
tara:strand:+ start:394 stop:594 length:201 start_codon:yes stop_codon:yes gene_type:complete